MSWKPEGIYPAMLTPFSNDGSIDEESIREIVDFCIQSGCTGFFSVSSVGEFVHMETAEACRLMEVTVEATKGRVPVVVGVTASHIGKSIELAKHARESGCAGIVCSPPYFYTITQDMIYRHFELLSEAVPDMPLILYNIPLFSTPLSYDVVARAATLPNVVAMKDSSGSLVDFMHFMDVIRQVGADINMMCGREEMIFPATMLGGKGGMNGTATIFPEVLVRIYDATLAGNYETARELQQAVCHSIRIMFSVPFPLGFKAAMEIRGFSMGPSKAAIPSSLEDHMITIRSDLYETLSRLCERADIPLVRGSALV